MKRHLKNMAAWMMLASMASTLVSAQAKPSTKKKAKTEERQAKMVAPEMRAVPAAAVADADYVIGNEDVLNVSVWKEPELSRSLPVRPDGKITLPLIGDVDAQGMTPKALQASIAAKLKAYISNPEVTVIVQEMKSQKFNVIGEVTRPGSYQLSKPMNILDAIALAGGFRDFAKTQKMYVLRHQANGTVARIPVDYKKVIKGKSPEQNIELQVRDTIVVP